MNQIVKCFITLIVVTPSLASAGLFRFESETMFTDRKDAYMRQQMPILESIQSSYATDSNGTLLNTNFSFFADPDQKNYNFQLYSLNGIFKPLDSVQFQVGRSFNTFFLVRATTTDSAAISWKPTSTLTLTGYGGLQQQTELQGVDIQTDLSGGSLHYQSSQYFPFKFQTAVEHLYYRTTYTSENIGKVTLSKQLELPLEPELSIGNEADLNTGHQNRFDVGMALYPNIDSIYNIRYLQYELNPQNGWEDPISTVIAQGRIDEASFGVNHSFSRQISYSLELAGDQYQLQQGLIATGGRGALDLKYKSQGNVVLANQIQRIQSYGGSVWADILQFQLPFWNKSSFMVNNEYISYEKITSSKRDAISTQIGVGALMYNHFKFNLLAEYNRNNFVQDEFKIIGQLLVMEWVEL